MAELKYPPSSEFDVLNDRQDRLDGPVKATGAAKYAADQNPPGLLYAKMLGSKTGYAVIQAIDTSAAEAMPSVKAVWVNDSIIGQPADYAGTLLAAVAATSEEAALDAIAKIKVTAEPGPAKWNDQDPALAEGEPSVTETKSGDADVEAVLAGLDAVSTGEYGCPTITHCCLEPHGHVAHFKDGELYMWPSTQNVSAYTRTLSELGGLPESKIHVDCQYMGGGFGSKFGADKWGDICNLLAQKSGQPVKLMLDRDMELLVGGNRPSTYATIRVGADKSGHIKALDSKVWGTSGVGNFNAHNRPYVFTNIPDFRIAIHSIPTHRAAPRAWRAPLHPQNCLITMCAVDDCAAAAGMDALEFFKLNADLTDRPDVYREELDIAAEMIGYKAKAHLRGDAGPGPVKRGLGVSIHTWGGRGHKSECDVSIHPDGSVEVKIGTQDLGTGTRTVIGMVVAETLGIPLEQVQVNIGRNAYPPSGASGGSTTVGGVSASSRIASTDALNALLDVVAKNLGVPAAKLEAEDGRILEVGNPSNSVSWHEACRMLGQAPISKRGVHEPSQGVEMGLIDSGVGGVQIADVSVDIETGIVRINEMVAVQDCGLIVNLKTAESQVYGGMIMGITYALYEEAIYDPVTGAMLNPNMEFYKLAGLPDVGTLKVHMMMDDRYQRRGVIGLGEPPVISPGAAISNAVANAIGVRVPHLPLTAERVLAALERKGAVA